MTGASLIDALISNYDLTTANDAGNTNRRVFLLHHLQMVVDEVWNHRAWSFKMRADTVTTANGKGALPTDFSRVGPEGWVWEESTARAWTETFIQDVMSLRHRVPTHTSKLFAIGSDDATGRALLIPEMDTPVTLTLLFEMTPPTVVDDTSGSLDTIPEEYHRTVILAGGIARTQTSKNDIRLYWEKQYLQGLGRMVARDLPLSSRIKQLPMSVGKRMW